MSNLEDSVQYLKGVGPQRCSLLQRLGINTVYDLLYYSPRKYLDRYQIKSISEVTSTINPDEEVTIKGRITANRLRRLKAFKTIFEIAVNDGTEQVSAVWFNQPYLQDVLTEGREVILSGKIRLYKYLQMSSPEYEIIPAQGSNNFLPLHTQGIIPCYSLTEGLTQKFLRRTVKNCLDKYLPSIEQLSKELSDLIPNLAVALSQIHYPDSQETLEKSRRRLVYDELFLFQLTLGLRHYRIKKTRVKFPLKLSVQLDERIRKRIPFKLTNAQERVIQEIRRDLIAPFPMNRLLQGDVGSGKTIVAVYAILAAIGNGLQAAFMAPTEILAEQHFRTISSILKDSKVRILYLTGALKPKEKKQMKEVLEKGEADLVIGTHA